MRILEIILLVSCITLPLLISIKPLHSERKRPLIFGVSALLGMLVLQLLLDGYRWQMTPLYLIQLISGFCLYKGYRFFKGGWFRKSTSILGWFLLVLIGGVLSIALPVFELPEPTGNYAVGAQFIHLKTDRDEPITQDMNDVRELMIKVWYPASIEQEEKEAYLDKAERTGFAEKYGLHGSVFNYLDQVETHTHQAPAVAEGDFPVLIFSHGYYSQASGYYALIEELVSQGFIVLNINHTYESAGSLFPDGSVKLYDHAFNAEKNNAEMAEMAWNATQGYFNAKTEQEQYKAVAPALRKYVAAEITQRWAADIRSVVDRIPQWNSTSFLVGHLDTSRIGAFGHSQGGAAAGQALLEDHRIKAAMNLDGVHWGNMVDTAMNKPFILLSSDWGEDHPDFNSIAYRNGGSADFFEATLNQSGHSNFMDVPFMIKIPVLNEAGAINPRKAIQVSSELSIQFFNRYLNDAESDLTEWAQRHPELQLIKKD